MAGKGVLNFWKEVRRASHTVQNAEREGGRESYVDLFRQKSTRRGIGVFWSTEKLLVAVL